MRFNILAFLFVAILAGLALWGILSLNGCVSVATQSYCASTTPEARALWRPTALRLLGLDPSFQGELICINGQPTVRETSRGEAWSNP